MARPPSQRELVATLVALCEADETEHQEFEEFLVAHSDSLGDTLQLSREDLLGLLRMSSEPRATRVRDAIRQAKSREQVAQVTAAQNLSLAAATMLALTATWENDRIVLDYRIVLGRNLLADRAKKFIRFDVEGQAPVTVRREKLCESGKALRFTDLSCGIDRRGLRFQWRQGNGGLVLVDQKVDERHREAILPVVIARKRAVADERFTAPARERRSGWLGDVFSELTTF